MSQIEALREMDREMSEAFLDVGFADIGAYAAPGDGFEERTVYVNSGQQTLGEFGQMLAPRTVIGFLVEDGVPVKGASVIIDDDSYELQAIDETDLRDGSIAWWVVRRV